MAPSSNVSLGRLGLVVALVLFAAICYLASRFDTFPGDRGAIGRFQDLRSGWLDDAAIGATRLADPLVALISIPVLALALWLIGKRRDALVALLIYVPEGIGLAVKELVARPRPELSLLASPHTNPGFPSGHALHAFLFVCFLGILMGETGSPGWLVRAVQALLGLAALSVGASRVYLGVHWPSDVLGAYFLGAISLAGLLWTRKYLSKRAAT